MKTLFVLASVMVVLFLVAPCKVEAQRRQAAIPAESTVNAYLRSRVTAESGGDLSLSGFRKTNGYQQGYGIYVIEFQAEILFEQEGYKAGNAFVGYWQDFRVLKQQPGTLDSLVVGNTIHFNKGTTVRLTGNATLRNTEKGWRLEGFDVKTSQVLAVNPSQVQPNSITFSDGTRYAGVVREGKPDGRGVLTFPDGRRQEGIWAKGKYLGSSGIARRTPPATPHKAGQNVTTAKTGTYAINPQFDSAQNFSEGLALVRIGDYETGKHSYIDKTGRIVIVMHSVFGDTGQNSFSNGLAAVVIGDQRNYKSGYIDKTGKIDIFPQFSWSREFSEGLAAVRVSEANFKWGFIDTTGKVAISPQFDETQNFSEGLAAVFIGDNKTGRWGYIDKMGKMVISPQFSNEEVSGGGYRWGAGHFHKGLAFVRFGDNQTNKWGYIDRTGQMVVSSQFGNHGPFSEGLAAVRIGDAKTGKWGFIDNSEKMVINPQFDSTWGFSEGLALVRIGDEETGKWGYIDKTGNIVVTPQFDSAMSFSEGLAVVRIGDNKTGKSGYIDQTGKLVIPPQFDSALSFSEGLAMVRIGDNKTGKWGYIFR